MLEITWRGTGEQPTQPPNPRYPNGKDVDISDGAAASCTTVLPCPAEGIGAWFVQCTECGYTAGVTAAGRIDDPKSIRVPCKRASPVPPQAQTGPDRREPTQGGLFR